MTPTVVAKKIRDLGVDHHEAVRAMVNAVAVNRGLAAPWDAPPLDLPTLADINEVGEVHEILLGRQDGKRGEQGSYFTPVIVADAITRISIELPLQQGKHPLSILAMDPACGAGVFLVSAAQKLTLAWLAIELGVLDPPDWMLRAALPLVASECVFGVDIDPVAVELAKAAMWLEAGGIPPITWMDRNIICGNTLEGDEPPKLRQRQAKTSEPEPATETPQLPIGGSSA